MDFTDASKWDRVSPDVLVNEFRQPVAVLLQWNANVALGMQKWNEFIVASIYHGQSLLLIRAVVRVVPFETLVDDR